MAQRPSTKLPRATSSGGFLAWPRRALAFLWLASVLLGQGAVGAAFAQVPSPALEGPITGPGVPFTASVLFEGAFDLAEVGYVQEEFFISGTASAYTNVGALAADGLWTVTTGETAAYKTRILVHRPATPRKFNGTVVVEWLNVSGGLDAAPDWGLAHVELIRRGYAWVGVSAQYVGVEGGGGILGILSLNLKFVNPPRYGSLVHPGDSFSYDIFSQAGQAIRSPAGASPLADLEVKRIIAAGESQSAFRMVTYVNAIHPLAGIYDGFFVHSRGAIGAALSQAPQPSIPVPGEAVIRSDVDVPVLTLETETDLTLLGYFGARQPDAENFRLWEAAGTAHADTYTLGAGAADLGASPGVVDLVITTSPIFGVDCGSPINSGPQHFVVKAALRALERWVRRGKPPRSAPRLEVIAGPPVEIARDENGNALGGIRTPQVDAPIAAFTGEQGGSLLCALFGTTTPFDDATLAALYPSHGAFVSRYRRALRRSVRAGWIVEADARLMRKWAVQSSIGR